MVSLTFDTVQWVCWLSWVPNSSVQKISQDLEFYSWGNFLEGITLATNDQAQYINRSGPQFPLRSHISVLLCVHQHQPTSCPSYHVQLHRPGIYACFQVTPAAAKCCGEQSRMRFFSRKYIFRSTCNTGRGTLVWWSVTREASRTEWLHWSILWQCLKIPMFSLILGIFQLSNFCQYIEFKEIPCCFSLFL